VRGHGSADGRAVTVDHVEDTLGDTGGVDALGDDEGVEGSKLGRLQDHGAASSDGGGDLAGNLVGGPVPGGLKDARILANGCERLLGSETHDETADTGSLLADEDVSAHLLELVRAKNSGGGREVADTSRGLGSVGEPHGGTHLVRDDLGKVGNALGVLGND
jgi:hypothetical protein